MSKPFMKKLNPFKPTDIGGCQLWLDGADTTTLTGSSPVTAWRDKSTNNLTLTATGSPTVTTVNGLNSLSFNGSSYFSLNPFTQAVGANYMSWFAVANITNAASTSYAAVIGTLYVATSNSQNELYINTGTAQVYYRLINPNTGYGNTGNAVARSTSITVNAGNVLLGTVTNFTTGTYQLFQNGTGGILQTDGPIGTNSLEQVSLQIGNDLYPGDGFIEGTISELLLYTTAITTAQRQKIEGYLAQKWGLVSTLPANNPGRTQLIYPHNLQVYGLATGQPTRKPYIIPKKILVLVGGVSVFSYLPLATNSTDVGGTPQTVTTNGTVTYTTIASKQCAYFSNSLSNYLSVTYVPQTQITLCFWLYVIDSGTYTAVSINDGALNPTLQITPVGGNFFYAHTAMPNQWTNVPQGSYPGPGQWVHFAITVNYATYFEEVYVNGTSVSTATGTGPPTIPQTNIWLGRSGDAARAYYGYIRQFCTFPSILTQAQIQSVITFTT